MTAALLLLWASLGFAGDVVMRAGVMPMPRKGAPVELVIKTTHEKDKPEAITAVGASWVGDGPAVQTVTVNKQSPDDNRVTVIISECGKQMWCVEVRP